ncbi:MAG: DUF1080 domain-containing protein, partial [Segetibacter sp.]|nr:DUF1080 domain-containing protein [Segetibacter sp.]
MKALICFSLLLSFAGASITNAQTKTKNDLSLFDSKTLNGWRNAQRDTLPDKAWYVQNS